MTEPTMNSAPLIMSFPNLRQLMQLKPTLVQAAIFTASIVFTGTFAGQGNCQMIVAHRGASYDAPENTLSAFREAWKQKADGIEGDFYFTRDAQIVCIHDKDTARTGGTQLDVAGSTLAELRQLEFGAWKSDRFQGEAIPTFAEVAAVVPSDKKFIIELKTGPEIVPLLVEELKKTSLDHRQLLIIAFNAETVAAAKKLLPDVRAHWLTSYKQDRSAAGKWHPGPREIMQIITECQADGLGTKAELAVVNQEFIAELKRLGLSEFHVWTVDSPTDAQYFQQLGAMGITTNRPALIRDALSAE
jgi:glycerophosphoryl diester phosphodiesterase